MASSAAESSAVADERGPSEEILTKEHKSTRKREDGLSAGNENTSLADVNGNGHMPGALEGIEGKEKKTKKRKAQDIVIPSSAPGGEADLKTRKENKKKHRRKEKEQAKPSEDKEDSSVQTKKKAKQEKKAKKQQANKGEEFEADGDAETRVIGAGNDTVVDKATGDGDARLAKKDKKKKGVAEAEVSARTAIPTVEEIDGDPDLSQHAKQGQSLPSSPSSQAMTVLRSSALCP